MNFGTSNKGNFNDLLKAIDRITALDGQILKADSLPMQMDFVRLEKTPEEAINRARLEAIKRGRPFKEPFPVADHKKEGEAMARKLMNDLIEETFRHHA